MNRETPERPPGIVEPTGLEVAYACLDVLNREDLEAMAEMEIDEALRYAYGLLTEEGIEDPEAFLRGEDILE